MGGGDFLKDYTLSQWSVGLLQSSIIRAESLKGFCYVTNFFLQGFSKWADLSSSACLGLDTCYLYMTGFICVAPLISFICTSKKLFYWCKKKYAYTGVRNVKEVSKKLVISHKMQPNYRRISNWVWMCNRAIRADTTPRKGKTGKILAYSDKVVGLC